MPNSFVIQQQMLGLGVNTGIEQFQIPLPKNITRKEKGITPSSRNKHPLSNTERNGHIIPGNTSQWIPASG